LSCTVSGQTLNELNNAYSEKSNKLLIAYLDKWVDKCVPYSKEQIDKMSKLEKESYNLYSIFYFQKNSITINEKKQNDFNYSIIQDSLVIQVVRDFSLKKINVSYFENKIVFLSYKLKKQFMDFFKTELDNKKRLKTFNDEKNNLILLDKLIYLQKSLYVCRSHWGDFIWIEKLPYVSKIIFDKKFGKAIIEYQTLFGVYYGIYKIENGNWKYINSKNILIQ
jgi:hypothetical protein